MDNQSIYINLGKTYDLASVSINWENAYARTYDVEAATDLTQAQPWTVVSGPLTKTSAAVDTVALANATGRYLKLGLLTRPGNSTNGFSIYEIQVYGYASAAGTTPASVQISPANVNVPVGWQVQFQAYALDAKADGGPAGAAAWTLSGGGGNPLSAAGLFSAQAAGGPFTVTGTVNPLSGSTSVTVGGTAGTGGTTYSTWQNQYFTAAELNNAGISGPTATLAGDGISNLMKYALNLDPKSSEVAGLPKVSSATIAGRQYLTLTYTQLLSVGDIAYAVEAGGDLQAWSSGPNATAVVSTATNPGGKPGRWWFQDLTAESSAARRFLRLRVTSP